MKYSILINLFIIMLFMGCKTQISCEKKLHQIYDVGNKYVFSYYYVDSNGQKLIYKFLKPFYPIYNDTSNSDDFNWKLVNINEENAVHKFSMNILKGKVNGNQIPIMYRYYQDGRKCTEEVTGLIQKEGKIWIHPPRKKGFEILEINPFIEVRCPLKKGFTWNTSLTIDDQWEDKRWKSWDGIIEFNSKYTNNGKKVISTKFGQLPCFEIEAVSTSVLGKTSSVVYFNETYGFVKMIYNNINDSKLIIELEEISFVPIEEFNTHYESKRDYSNMGNIEKE